MVIVDRLFHEAHTPLGEPLLASVSEVLNSTHCQYLHQLRTHSLLGARDVAFPRLNTLSYWIFVTWWSRS